jgi:hypothetical protein
VGNDDQFAINLEQVIAILAVIEAHEYDGVSLINMAI